MTIGLTVKIDVCGRVFILASLAEKGGLPVSRTFEVATVLQCGSSFEEQKSDKTWAWLCQIPLVGRSNSFASVAVTPDLQCVGVKGAGVKTTGVPLAYQTTAVW